MGRAARFAVPYLATYSAFAGFLPSALNAFRISLQVLQFLEEGLSKGHALQGQGLEEGHG